MARPPMIRRAVRWLDTRVGAAPGLRKALRYVFPDHWSFMLGEIALYAFVVLVATGIFLTLHYEPSQTHIHYTGPYQPLQGLEMSKAYESVVDISFEVPAGLLIRQTHHWAADVFLAAIVLHVFRVFFTGGFRRPRDINWFVGLSMLMLAIVEGYLGYSLVDDLLSGMGLAIGYSVFMSVPVLGAQLVYLIWGGPFPGSDAFLPRMEILHVLVVPVALAALMSLHMAIIVRQHHSQFPGPGRTERNVVGTPMWPAYALRSLGLLFAVVSVLVLLGGLVQINPIWEWGPYETYLSTNAAQPDWYIGWLIGALRLMFALEPHVGGVTLIPTPFWGGLLFPLLVFGALFSWPALERRITGDHRRHELLDSPRDNPWRTGVGMGFLTWVWIPFFAGSSDRVFYALGISYSGQIWFFRVAAWVAPLLVYRVTRRICEELRDREVHPLRAWEGSVLRRGPRGGFEPVARGGSAPGGAGAPPPHPDEEPATW